VARHEAALRILIYLAVNLNRNNAHFANFAFSDSPFCWQIAHCFFAQNFASKFGQGLTLLVHATPKLEIFINFSI